MSYTESNYESARLSAIRDEPLPKLMSEEIEEAKIMTEKNKEQDEKEDNTLNQINETLVSMTRELADMLRKNRTIDWQKKESARAGMRSIVKRLLKRYKYPPEGVEDAITTVIKQCEVWADN